MNIDDVKKRFLEDTENHTMSVRLDGGNNRHLIFSNQGSSVYRYEIITWDGYLCYCGDMGCFVFTRIEDMFHFFRGDGINLGYWSEKLEADGVNEGYKEYSEKVFNDLVIDHIKDNWEFDNDDQKEEVVSEVKHDILDQEFERDAYRVTSEYESDYGHRFEDFWEHKFTQPTHRYIWCCFAIVQGIKQYDKWKEDQ
jgi:hypothetical protein